MPNTEGTYHVFIDLFAEGILIGAYRAVEDVVIRSVAAYIATLRPTANGGVIELTPNTGANYDCVDDANGHDGDATYVFSTEDLPSRPEYQLDLYALESMPPSVGINKITLHYFIRTDSWYTYAHFRPALKTHGEIYYGTDRWLSRDPSGPDPGGHKFWTEETLELTLNPHTGKAWTEAEVNALQAGQSLKSAPSITAPVIPTFPVLCTQVYGKVEFLA